jgi:replicative DNA helicase
LLGAIILDPRQYNLVRELVTGNDFSDPTMGAIFTGMGLVLAKGQTIDAATIGNYWPEWEIHGLEPSVVFEWISAEVAIYAAPDYARAVRDTGIRRAIRDIVANAQGKAQDPGAQPLDTVASAVVALERLRQGATSGGMSAKTLGEILEGSDDYDWIIPGLIERTDRLILTGSEGVGKTTWVRQLAICSAAGIHPTHFTPVEPVRVLVIDAENTERQWRRSVRYYARLAAMNGAADPRLTVRIVAGHRVDITRGSHLGEIHRLVDLHKPDIVFIGPLYKLVPKAINNDDDAAPLIVALDSLRERGLALIMEAHAGKSLNSDGERDLKPRGSSALMGWPEFGLGMRSIEGTNDVRLIHWRGDREERAWPSGLYRGGDYAWSPAL